MYIDVMGYLALMRLMGASCQIQEEVISEDMVLEILKDSHAF
jgi:hypothetical protein